MYFLPAIVAIGSVTTYQDIKHGKIKNKWIISALVYALIMNIALICFHHSIGDLNARYIIELFTNLIFAIIIGFGLWLMKIWTGGDGKLFIAFAALIPLSSYSYGYQDYIPSITLLINTFVPTTIILIIITLLKSSGKDIKEATVQLLKDSFNPGGIISSFLGLFSIFWVMQSALYQFGLGESIYLRFFLSMLFLSQLEKWDKKFYIIIPLAIARTLLDNSIFTLTFLLQMLSILIVWRLLFSILTGGVMQLGHNIFSREVKMDDLEPGMIMSEVIESKNLSELSGSELKKLKSDKRIKIRIDDDRILITKPQEFKDKGQVVDCLPEGLDKKQIKLLKTLGIPSIRICNTIPFAPFLFAGALLTIAAKGNILISLMIN